MGKGRKKRKLFTPFGCVTLIAAFMALTSILPFRDAWKRHEDGKRYTKQVFQCSSLELTGEDSDVSKYRVKGTVLGNTEYLYTGSVPGGAEAAGKLNDTVVETAFTSSIDVWYNPDMPEKTRVLNYDPDRFAGTKKDAMIVTVFGFGPLILSLLFVSIMVIYKRVNEINRKRREG